MGAVVELREKKGGVYWDLLDGMNIETADKGKKLLK